MSITEYRLRLGWSITDLANAAGLTYQTVSRMEKGQPARDYNVAKIAMALSAALSENITVNDFKGVKFSD
jgi:DNA-binding XRE family transcriptional regulator